MYVYSSGKERALFNSSVVCELLELPTFYDAKSRSSSFRKTAFKVSFPRKSYHTSVFQSSVSQEISISRDIFVKCNFGTSVEKLPIQH